MQKKYYLQCQGHSEGLYIQNMTISTISSKLLVRFQLNLVCWYSIISWSALSQSGYCVQGQGHSKGSKCQ